MTRKMWAVVDGDHIVKVSFGYWAIINSYGCRRKADFRQKNPRLRIKHCTVTIP